MMLLLKRVSCILPISSTTTMSINPKNPPVDDKASDIVNTSLLISFTLSSMMNAACIGGKYSFYVFSKV